MGNWVSGETKGFFVGTCQYGAHAEEKRNKFFLTENTEKEEQGPFRQKS